MTTKKNATARSTKGARAKDTSDSPMRKIEPAIGPNESGLSDMASVSHVLPEQVTSPRGDAGKES